MHKLVAVFFAICCLATAAISNSILGPGFWFWVIIATGLFVAVSQLIPVLRQLGNIAALLLAVISVCAVLLTLLAATTGGSFELDTAEASLVFAFFMIAVFGFALARINRRPK